MLPWGIGKENNRHYKLTAYEGFCLERSMSTSGTSCIAAQLKEVIGPGLTNKPRETGLTAVLDKRLGLRAILEAAQIPAKSSSRRQNSLRSPRSSSRLRHAPMRCWAVPIRLLV